MPMSTQSVNLGPCCTVGSCSVAPSELKWALSSGYTPVQMTPTAYPVEARLLLLKKLVDLSLWSR